MSSVRVESLRSRDTAITGRAAFFAPWVLTVPFRGRPPLIRIKFLMLVYLLCGVVIRIPELAE